MPDALTLLTQWVLWRDVDGRKIPYQANGRPAKVNDQTTWGDFDALRDVLAAGEYTGLGFVFTEADPFVGIDLDGCRDESGGVTSWAAAITGKILSYDEISPSGTGYKIFAEGRNPLGVGKNRKLDGDAIAGKSPGVEIYDRGRWFAVTGQGGGEIRYAQDEINAFCEEYWPTPTTPSVTENPDHNSSRDANTLDRARAYIAKIPPSVSGSGGHNAAFSCAVALVKGFDLDAYNARSLFSEWNAGCEPPWSDREIEHKLKQAAKASDARGYLLDKPTSLGNPIDTERFIADAKDALTDSTDLKKTAENLKAKPNTAHAAALKYIEKLGSHEDISYTSGIPAVDRALSGGIERGEMMIVAARPSHGKSAFCLQALDENALIGYPCLMISEEMGDLAIGKRVIQYASSTPVDDWRTNIEFVRDQIEDHYSQRSEVYMAYDCRDIESVEVTVRDYVEKYGVKVVAVDYAQQLKSKGKSRYEQVSHISIALKHLATECNVAMIVLAQLNRGVESRDSFEPKASDLRDSGQLEQDADCIISLVWPNRVDDSVPKSVYTVYVQKNRNREIKSAKVACKFDPARQTIRGDSDAVIVERNEAFDIFNSGG